MKVKSAARRRQRIGRATGRVFFVPGGRLYGAKAWWYKQSWKYKP